MSAIQTIAIAASTSHGERACSSTSATHAPSRTSHPTTSIGSRRCVGHRRSTHAGATSSQNSAATPQTAPTHGAGQPRAKPASGENSSTAPATSAPPTTAAHRDEANPVRRAHSYAATPITASVAAPHARGGSRNSAASTSGTSTSAVRMRVLSMSAGAARHAPCAACTCSLVRPNLRSRPRYDAIAASSAAASKSGHRRSVKWSSV